MNTYIKINDVLYPATIGGRLNDGDWNNRSSKFIHLEISHEKAFEIFKENLEWYIVQEIEERVEKIDEETQEISYETIVNYETYDNSDYSVLGDITVHSDGTVTVKMGKPTAEEILQVILGGIV